MDSIRTWIGAYLYYPEPWEEFLVHGVKPFVEIVFEKKLVEQFFFIRYWERGPHIRLRFKGNKNRLEKEVKNTLEIFFTKYFEDHPSKRKKSKLYKKLPAKQQWFPNHSIQHIEYKPEIARYGGPAGVLIAEEQFEASSRAVLSILEESEAWNYEQALGYAIQLHLSFAFAMSMDLMQAKQFYSHIFQDWFVRSYRLRKDISEEGLTKYRDSTLKAFEEIFNNQKSTLISYHKALWRALEKNIEFEQNWLNNWLNEMTIISNKLKKAQKEHKLIFLKRFVPNSKINVSETNQILWAILGSYVHMTNNRLGILNRDEAYLGYLIKRSLQNI